MSLTCYPKSRLFKRARHDLNVRPTDSKSAGSAIDCGNYGES